MHIYVIDIIKQCYSDIYALKFSKMNSTEFSAIFLCLFAVVVQISGYDRKCTKWEIAFGCNPKVCIRIFFSFFAYPNTYSKAMLARTASAYWLSDSNIWKEIFQIIGSRELRFWPCLIYIFRARLTVSEQKIESLSTGSIHTKFKPSTSLILACTFSILLSITSLVVLRRSLLISLYHLQSVMTFLKSPLRSL